MKQLYGLNQQLTTLVHKKPHILQHSTQKRRLSKEEIHALTDAGVAFINEKYQSAIVQYKKCLQLNIKYNKLENIANNNDNNNNNNIDENEQTKLTVVVSYIISQCLLESNEFQDILEAKKIITELEETVGDIYPMIYYGFAKLLTILYCFNDAEKMIAKGFTVIKDETYLQDLNVPEHDYIIPESQIKKLTVLLLNLKKSVDSWHPPDAKCIMSNCYEISQNHLSGQNIYFKSPAFNGFIKVICNNIHHPCTMLFHIACWKNKKELLSPNQKLSDKDMLNWNCLTPNCEYDNLPCLISKICVYGDDAKLKSVTETPVDKLHWQPHHQQQQQQCHQCISKGAIRKQLKPKINNNNHLQKTLKINKQTTTTTTTTMNNKQKPDDDIDDDNNNNNNNHNINNSIEKENDNLKIVVEVPLKVNDWNDLKKNVEKEKNQSNEIQESKDLIQQLKSFYSDVSDDEDEYFNNSSEESLKKEEEKKNEISDLDKLKSFIYTWFFECLIENGPIKCDILMEKWQEAMDIIGDSAELLNQYNNIDKVKKFLLEQSSGIVSYHNYICTSTSIAEAIVMSKIDSDATENEDEDQSSSNDLDDSDTDTDNDNDNDNEDYNNFEEINESNEFNLHEKQIYDEEIMSGDKETQKKSLINQQLNFNLNNNNESVLNINEQENNISTNNNIETLKTSDILIHEFLPYEKITSDKNIQVSFQNNELKMLNIKLYKLNREILSYKNQLSSTKKSLENQKIYNYQNSLHNEYVEKKIFLNEVFKKYKNDCLIIEKLRDIEKKKTGNNDETLINHNIWLDAIDKINKMSEKLDSDYAKLYELSKSDDNNKKNNNLNIQGIYDLPSQNIPDIIQNIFDKCFNNIENKYQLLMEQKSQQLSTINNQQVWYPHTQNQYVHGLYGINPPNIIPSQSQIQLRPPLQFWNNNSTGYSQIISRPQYLTRITPPVPAPSPSPPPPPPPSPSPSQSQSTSTSTSLPTPVTYVNQQQMLLNVNQQITSSAYSQSYYAPPFQYYTKPPCPVHFSTVIRPPTADVSSCPPIKTKTTKAIITDPLTGKEIKLNDSTDDTQNNNNNNNNNNTPIASLSPLPQSPPKWVKKVTEKYLNATQDPYLEQLKDKITINTSFTEQETTENNKKIAALLIDGIIKHLIGSSNTDNTQESKNEEKINNGLQQKKNENNNNNNNNNNITKISNDKSLPLSLHSSNEHFIKESTNKIGTTNNLIGSQSSISSTNDDSSYIRSSTHEYYDDTDDSESNSADDNDNDNVIIENNYVTSNKLLGKLCNKYPDILECDIKSAIEVVRDSYNGSLTGSTLNRIMQEVDQVIWQSKTTKIIDNSHESLINETNEDKEIEKTSYYYENPNKRYSTIKLVASDEVTPTKDDDDDNDNNNNNNNNKIECLWDMGPPSSLIPSSKKQKEFNDEIKKKLEEYRKTKPLGDYFWDIDEPSTFASVVSSSLANKQNTNTNQQTVNTNTNINQQTINTNTNTNINQQTTSTNQIQSQQTINENTNRNENFMSAIELQKNQQKKLRPSDLTWRITSPSSSFISSEKRSIPPRFQKSMCNEETYSIARANKPSSYEKLLHYFRKKYPKTLEYEIHVAIAAVRKNYNGSLSGKLFSKIIRDVEKNLAHREKAQIIDYNLTDRKGLPKNKQRINLSTPSVSTETKSRLTPPALMSQVISKPRISSTSPSPSTASASASAQPRREYHAIMNPWSKPKETQTKLITGECVICMENYSNEKNDICELDPCLHTFHRHCIEYWYKHNKTCPTCRLDSALDQFPPLA